ncbi:MAG: superoxide dismutase [Puniceicoccales bacterium]|jgi:Fe-Mn family superoxide dismutase|nr:superoxide dismutase [Puniceicoccales bacterium]
MTIFKAQIPYDSNTSLVPILSTETLDYHYGKHHVGYAKTLQTLVDGTDFAGRSLEEIIAASRGKNQKIFNNASQLFNHDFYWKCLKISERRPSGKLKDIICSQYGSFDEFLSGYISCANSLFGSGWSWLILANRKLLFANTTNSEIPIGLDTKLICVIDLWEHAYYIDYRNDRSSYINNAITKCINWEFCESLL